MCVSSVLCCRCVLCARRCFLSISLFRSSHLVRCVSFHSILLRKFSRPPAWRHRFTLSFHINQPQQRERGSSRRSRCRTYYFYCLCVHVTHTPHTHSLVLTVWAMMMLPLLLSLPLIMLRVSSIWHFRQLRCCVLPLQQFTDKMYVFTVYKQFDLFIRSSNGHLILLHIIFPSSTLSVCSAPSFRSISICACVTFMLT